MKADSRIKILTGHFGSGKTEISIHLALEQRKLYEQVAINDLDVINPYYRVRDAKAQLIENDIKVIAPEDRLTNADLPIVSGEIYSVLNDSSWQLIMDAGGDKDGATALGQYYHHLKDEHVDVYFVINTNRPYVSTVEGAIDTMKRIESASRLSITGIINNSNVGKETTLDDIKKGLEISQHVSKVTGVPFLYSTISENLKDQTKDFAAHHDVKYIRRFLSLPWE